MMLLDVVVIVSHIEKDDDGNPYPVTTVTRCDLPEDKQAEFYEALTNATVHVETLKAS